MEVCLADIDWTLLALGPGLEARLDELSGNSANALAWSSDNISSAQVRNQANHSSKDILDDLEFGDDALRFVGVEEAIPTSPAGGKRPLFDIPTLQRTPSISLSDEVIEVIQPVSKKMKIEDDEPTWNHVLVMLNFTRMHDQPPEDHEYDKQDVLLRDRKTTPQRVSKPVDRLTAENLQDEGDEPISAKVSRLTKKQQKYVYDDATPRVIKNFMELAKVPHGTLTLPAAKKYLAQTSKFAYATPEDPNFGHLNAYQYQDMEAFAIWRRVFFNNVYVAARMYGGEPCDSIQMTKEFTDAFQKLCDDSLTNAFAVVRKLPCYVPYERPEESESDEEEEVEASDEKSGKKRTAAQKKKAKRRKKLQPEEVMPLLELVLYYRFVYGYLSADGKIMACLEQPVNIEYHKKTPYKRAFMVENTVLSQMVAFHGAAFPALLLAKIASQFVVDLIDGARRTLPEGHTDRDLRRAWKAEYTRQAKEASAGSKNAPLARMADTSFKIWLTYQTAFGLQQAASVIAKLPKPQKLNSSISQALQMV